VTLVRNNCKHSGLPVPNKNSMLSTDYSLSNEKKVIKMNDQISNKKYSHILYSRDTKEKNLFTHCSKELPEHHQIFWQLPQILHKYKAPIFNVTFIKTCKKIII